MKLSTVICIVFTGLTAFMLVSCSTGNELTKKRYNKVKNPPAQKPFVYYNKINIVNQTLNKEEKTILTSNLNTQLDDSMQVRVKENFLIFKKLIDPSVFDSVNADASARNMEIYLKTIGYYYGTVTHKATFDTVTSKKQKQEIHANTEFTAYTGPLVKTGTVEHILFDTTLVKTTPYFQHLAANLQQLTTKNLERSLLKPGVPFTENLMLNELERLVELYRNNGYYKFSREQLFVDADSFYLPLLNPFLDPFERIQVLQDAKKWRENPTFNIVIRLRPKIDSTSLLPYKTGTITVYPEYTNAAFDSSKYETIDYKNIFIKNKTGKYKPEFIATHIFLKKNNVYKLTELNRTLDELNSLGTWQFIKVETAEQTKTTKFPDSGIVNFDFRMVPNKKYTFSADLETVFNQVQQAAVGVAGNLIGVGINLGIRDRNFLKRGVLFSNTFRFGVESGTGRVNPGLQAIEFTYSSSLSISRLILMPYSKLFQNHTNKRSFISATASYIDRNINANGLYSLNNINISAGWQATKATGKTSTTLTIQPLNVEFVKLYDLSQPFKDTLDKNAFLRFSFRQGLVMGLAATASHARRITERKSLYYRLGFEESGLTWGRSLRSFTSVKDQLFTYIKLDAEIKYTKINSDKSNWVFRAVTGAGYNFADTASMPFFKQFTGGGPNSMRAWPLRSIGPGSRPLDSRSGRGQFFSRSGDFIFEVNAEYRYNIYTVIPNTFVVRGALFTDVGNVWNFRNKSNTGNDTVVIQFKNIYRDLGVSAGTGVRFDFVGLFVIRLDFALRVKNPSKPFSDKDNGWRIPEVSWNNIFGRSEINRQWRYENFNFSLGINYPF